MPPEGEAQPSSHHKALTAPKTQRHHFCRNSGDIRAQQQTTLRLTDRAKRDFTAIEPGRKYMGDITYLPLAGGEFLYLATVLDCFSRKVVGWSIADHMRTGLVADALRMAASTRGRLDGAVFHSDHGAQYVSRAFAGLCDQLGVTRSMGEV
ncbi:hypothetical protein GCM10010094_92240 [Streptomyces flaveus]|uniref:Integrase catalytic domain-containing protein n=1 Tax=Streptomyces flaveus TaxID=66370 RepID=A0A917RP13_9ACTN|nr:hypothetical protein GCM10010094_92240 [Streptomyces flaveus]